MAVSFTFCCYFYVIYEFFDLDKCHLLQHLKKCSDSCHWYFAPPDSVDPFIRSSWLTMLYINHCVTHLGNRSDKTLHISNDIQYCEWRRTVALWALGAARETALLQTMRQHTATAAQAETETQPSDSARALEAGRQVGKQAFAAHTCNLVSAGKREGARLTVSKLS